MKFPAVAQRLLARQHQRMKFLATGVLLHGTALALWVWCGVTVFYAPGAALLPLVLALSWVVPVTWLQRRRFAAFAGIAIAPNPPVEDGSWPRRARARLRSRQYWRQIAYHQVAGVFLGVVEAALLLLWTAGWLGFTLYAWLWLFPMQWPIVEWANVDGWILSVLGIPALLAAPRLTRSLLRLELPVAQRLLGASRAEELERRVEDLTERRADTVAAADAERRRIERDLHDGAQQRLVSLAVNLGLARATLTDLPPEARQVIDEAHREAKEALEELNQLVRGLHPHVLDDRGLDAALSGIAARTPIPVQVRVDVARRAAPAVEAVAYFVVSEALANVTKHSGASRAEVTAGRAGDTLRIRVTDDGKGGADPAAGTGLTGLARRVASVDGSLAIDSPRGGPTIVTVELPCTL